MERDPMAARTAARSALAPFLALSITAVLAAPVAAAPAAAVRPLDPARLNAFVGEQVRRHHLPGLGLGVVEGDRVVDLQGFGAADGTGRPVTAQTPFLLASVSKPLTATAVMQLVESRRVDLDTPVKRYVPEFR